MNNYTREGIQSKAPQ